MGQSIARSGQQGAQQALGMLRPSNAGQILAQLASNPNAYLNNPYLQQLGYT